jgi:phosphomevalonate kinase
MKIDKKIVAISGKQFSGKDTVADVLVTELSGFVKAPLAKLIKEKFSQEKGLAVDIIDMNKPVYRVDLIELGNRMREEDPDYWIKAVLEAGDSILVSDMRLKNEFNSFKKMNAITIRVNSPREERAKRGLIVSEYDSTEVDLDDITEWDYVLYNDGTHEELKQKARDLANEIKKRLI